MKWVIGFFIFCCIIDYILYNSSADDFLREEARENE